jgi:iron complex transport system substrate-binding protein
MRKIACVALSGLFILTVLASLAEAREITDMYGRKYSISDYPRKVYSPSPPDTYVLYAIDPTMLAGLNFPVKEKDKKFLHKSILKLPVIGGWFGQANTPNLEMLVKVNPELVVVSRNDTAMGTKITETMKMLKKPVFDLSVYWLSEYPDAFLRMGLVLGREVRARKLAEYSRATLSEAAAFSARLPRDKKVSVYYGEGPDGLSTECDNSRHSELINLAGGINVHHCSAKDFYGMEKVSVEQVLLYNPDVILAMDKGFFQNVFRDPRWLKVRAVRQKRVYLIPDQPINWFDRPPSFMRLIGLKWLMNLLYPNEYRIDIIKEAGDFYRLFLGVEVSNSEMRKIIHRQ